MDSGSAPLRGLPGMTGVVLGMAAQLSELPTAFSRMPQASSPYFFFHSA
jgi:hypothetical protein